MKKFLFLIGLSYTTAFAQPANYTTGNAHSHNDYQQGTPFFAAYGAQFGSIEVDVFLEKDELLVAHTADELGQHRTLEDLYLKPLQAGIENNKGYVYADTSRKLQLMLDIKTDASSSLNKLLTVLNKYPQLTHCRTLTFLISGVKPDPSTYNTYPSYIWFDGLLSEKYSKETLARIAMLSDNFLNYSKWRGKGTVPAKDWETLQKLVAKAHALGKTVRFWNTPDYMDVWQQLTILGVDYINTDSIRSLAAFLKNYANAKK